MRTGKLTKYTVSTTSALKNTEMKPAGSTSRTFFFIYHCPPLSILRSIYQYFCLHGGLSPKLESINDIMQLNRHADIPHEGPLCDLLWSDPEENKKGWGVSPRGAGWVWGLDITDKFLHTNKVSMICRAH
jgi:diadenosine tetraphosphatase ApaH/serine/threonine PP2A family protein phosphatase